MKRGIRFTISANSYTYAEGRYPFQAAILFDMYCILFCEMFNYHNDSRYWFNDEIVNSDEVSQLLSFPLINYNKKVG